MKSQVCPHCGRSTTGTECEYCGQQLPKFINITATINYKKLLKKIFNPYSIGISILWTFCCIVNISSIEKDGLLSYLGVGLFGYTFFIILANIIYRKKHPAQAAPQREAVATPSYSTQTDFISKPYDQMEGHEFEYYCADILGKNGFSNIEVTKGSGDQGIDIIAHKDGIKYGIQCKCYTSDIGNKAVQEAFAGKTYYGCHVAAVLTNRYFTKSAKELAETNGVLLWDREKLNALLL